MTLIMNDKYKRIIEMSALPLMLLFLSTVALTFQSCKGKSKSNNLSAATDSLSDDALMDTVQRRTFLYWLPNVIMWTAFILKTMPT